jgi:hypothetical protein
MSAPVRYPNGVTNSAKETNMGMAIMPDPAKVHMYFDDFDKYVAADWTITTTENGGSATEALGNADGGVLVITNFSADDDADFFQKKGESFKFVVGKKIWFKSRFKVSDATQSDFVMGLQLTDTSPLAVDDGVFFRKDDGDAYLDFVVTKNGTATTATAIHTVVDDTYLVAGFYYNGVDAIEYYINDVKIGTSVVTNMSDDEELTVSFGIQNGVAVAKIMTVDYILAAKERG